MSGALLLALAVSEPAAHAQRVNFTYTGKLVTWTVPKTGTYQIIAYGAQGGSISGATILGPYMSAGGRGAEIGGNFALTAGEALQIAVGGAGISEYHGGSGSGGGGSFVVGPDNTPLVIAGGGGGGGAGASPDSTGNFGIPGGDGLTGPGGTSGLTGPGGTGYGGRGGGGSGGGGGGGGFLGAGQNEIFPYPGCARVAAAEADFQTSAAVLLVVGSVGVAGPGWLGRWRWIQRRRRRQ